VSPRADFTIEVDVARRAAGAAGGIVTLRRTSVRAGERVRGSTDSASMGLRVYDVAGNAQMICAIASNNAQNRLETR